MFHRTTTAALAPAAVSVTAFVAAVLFALPARAELDSLGSPEDWRSAPTRAPVITTAMTSFPAPLPGVGPGARFGYHALTTWLAAPLYLGDPVVVIAGTGYRLYTTRLEGVEGAAGRDLTLHRLSFSTLAAWRVNRSWSVSLRLSGALAGDYGQLASQSFMPSLIGQTTWRLDGAHSLQFGFYAARYFFTRYPVPGIGYSYRPPSGRVWFESFLPMSARLRFRVADGMEVALAARYAGARFDISPKNGVERHHFRLAEFTTTASLLLRVVGDLWLDTSLGVVPRKLTYQTSGADRPTEAWQPASALLSFSLVLGIGG